MTESNFFHIIHTSITGKEGDRMKTKLGDNWLLPRIEIFKNFTLKSLLNQENRNFLHWISFTPIEKDKKEILELSNYLKSLDYNFVFTFSGHPYWDTHGNNKKLMKRMEDSFSIIKKFVHDKDYIYFTVIDSDDAFHREVVKEIQNCIFKERVAYYFKNGYVFNFKTKELGDWKPTNPAPFYTIPFQSEVFWNAQKNWEYQRGLRVHHILNKCFDVEQLSDGKYMVGIHNLNNTTRWTEAIRKKNISNKEEKIKILDGFGLSDYVK